MGWWNGENWCNHLTITNNLIQQYSIFSLSYFYAHKTNVFTYLVSTERCSTGHCWHLGKIVPWNAGYFVAHVERVGSTAPQLKTTATVFPSHFDVTSLLKKSINWCSDCIHLGIMTMKLWLVNQLIRPPGGRAKPSPAWEARWSSSN